MNRMQEVLNKWLNGCEEGNVTIVQSLLDQGLDVNIADEDETTALQVAAANGHEHLIRFLLMRGAALDKPNLFGWTPLLLAARHGHVNAVALLLQNKADLNARTKLGANAITLAARGGHLKTCRLLVEAGIDLSPGTGIGSSACEFTPLMAAANYGHDMVVRLLLDRGCDVNYRTLSTGLNSLMLTGLNGHMTTAQVLVERGADPNHTNVNEHTPLQFATLCTKREVKGYLERKTTNKPKQATENVKPDIIEAARKGDFSRIREILEEDLTQRDASSAQDGATPLMFAAMTGRIDVAQYLVEKGCDINKQDTVSGWTALMQATYHGKKLVAKYLLNAGAEVRVPAKNGCTAFDLASLIEDMDTELYRLMAAKAVQISRKSRTWSPKQNGLVTLTPTSPSNTTETSCEEQPKTGLKAWWNRMSNRFRNLKLGRTFSSTNRLAPYPADVVPRETTITSNSSPQVQHTPATPKKSLTTVEPLATNTMTSLSTVTSYDTIMLETKKSAAMYTLGFNQPHASLHNGTLKPVIPPFLPPPTYEENRPKMPTNTARKSVASMETSSSLSSTRPVLPPMKLLQSYSSTQNLSSASSPSGSGPATSAPGSGSTSASPSSSAGASGLSGATSGGKSKGPSSASSSTLTAGSDNLNRSGASNHSEPLFTPSSRAPQFKPSPFLAASAQHFNRSGQAAVRLHTSPSSSISGMSSLPRDLRHHSHGKSQGSSKDSASTLTPSPSPTPKAADQSSSSASQASVPTTRIPLPEEAEDLGGILKTLSLERYQPIFEEQEVDMEAFLTLTDRDLKELGISHQEPRRQILTAITELNSGKGRERQHFQETMSQYNSTLRSTSGFEDALDYSQWSLQEESQSQGSPVENSSKSRSS